MIQNEDQLLEALEQGLVLIAEHLCSRDAKAMVMSMGSKTRATTGMMEGNLKP